MPNRRIVTLVERSVLLALIVVGCQPETTTPPSPATAPVAIAEPSAPPPSAEAPGQAESAPGQAEPLREQPEPATGPAESLREHPKPATEEPEPSDGGLVPLESNTPPPQRLALPEPQLPVKASRIRPGTYQCKISREYRFRPCTVELDEHGRSILTIPQALIGIQGVLTDVGSATQFDGIKTRDRPFGCYGCQERCSIDPTSCACKENPPVAIAECLMTPVRFKFKKKDGKWRGRIEHHHYYGQLDPEDGHPLFEVDHFSFVMRR